MTKDTIIEMIKEAYKNEDSLFATKIHDETVDQDYPQLWDLKIMTEKELIIHFDLTYTYDLQNFGRTTTKIVAAAHGKILDDIVKTLYGNEN